MKVISLFFTVLLVVTLFIVGSSIEAGLEPVPYEHYCNHKHGLDFGDMRRVMLYAHNLLHFKSGEKFAAAIQKCKHHIEEDEVKCGDDAATRAAVHELLQDPAVEKERRALHQKSRKGFNCVHEFETAVATEHKDQHWHLPATFDDWEHEQVEDYDQEPHDDGDFDEHRRRLVDHFNSLHDPNSAPPHPDHYHA